MYQAKDGKKFGSKFRGRKYDEVHKPSEDENPVQHEAMESDEFERGEQEGMKEAHEGSEDTHPVVAEHGPASHVSIHHDHKNNKHKVVSHHEDGHTNVSEHEDAKTAHEEGGKLANASLKATGEAGDQQGAASEGDNDNIPGGFVMPTLT